MRSLLFKVFSLWKRINPKANNIFSQFKKYGANVVKELERQGEEIRKAGKVKKRYGKDGKIGKRTGREEEQG